MLSKALSIIALIVSCMWLIAAPSYEPVIAVITSLLALATAFFVPKHSASSGQVQSVDNGSAGIQAGGNIHVGSVTVQEKTKDAK